MHRLDPAGVVAGLAVEQLPVLRAGRRLRVDRGRAPRPGRRRPPRRAGWSARGCAPRHPSARARPAARCRARSRTGPPAGTPGAPPRPAPCTSRRNASVATVARRPRLPDRQPALEGPRRPPAPRPSGSTLAAMPFVPSGLLDDDPRRAFRAAGRGDGARGVAHQRPCRASRVSAAGGSGGASARSRGIANSVSPGPALMSTRHLGWQVVQPQHGLVAVDVGDPAPAGQGHVAQELDEAAGRRDQLAILRPGRRHGSSLRAAIRHLSAWRPASFGPSVSWPSRRGATVATDASASVRQACASCPPKRASTLATIRPQARRRVNKPQAGCRSDRTAGVASKGLASRMLQPMCGYGGRSAGRTSP